MHTSLAFFGSIQRIVFVGLLLIASPFVWIGISEGWRSWEALQHFPRASGVVVANTYRSDADGGAFYPVVVFAPADGPELQVTAGVGSLPPDYIVGSRIELLYNPEKPQEITMISWKRLWLVPILLVSVGLLPLLGYAGWMISQRLRHA